MVKIEVDGTTLRRWLRPLLVVLLVAAIAMLAAIALRSQQGDPLAETVRQDRWQAVFLTNDRVYFGRLRALDGDWYVLRDAYFIREKPTADEQEGAARRSAASSQQVASVREELHGPDPDLVLNAEEVVLVENLSRKSRVADAIESLQDK